MQRKLFDKKSKEGGHGRVETRPPVFVATYKVNHSDELLEFLLKKRKDSRNNVKNLLTRKLVLVNGSVVTQYNFPLAKDDEVKVAKTPMKSSPSNKLQRAITPARPKFSLKILFENDEIIAVEKPVGLLSVESDKESDCAFKEVMNYLSAKQKNARPYILHRIDKETSGILLFAKDIKIHSKLKMRWNELVKTREYYAVVEGVLEKKQDVLLSYLKETQSNLMYATQDPTGQKAITHYEVVAENAEYSLLKVRIDTGRKNQIRVQFLSIGHPVVGDEKYGSQQDPLGRLGLHASKIELEHPDSGELLSFFAPVPPSFRALFKKTAK